MKLEFMLNSVKTITDISPDAVLLDVLRSLGCYSVKRGCETANCGLCTVLMDDKPILSCSTPAMRANGKRITTLEGLQAEAEEFAGFMADHRRKPLAAAVEADFFFNERIPARIAFFRKVFAQKLFHFITGDRAFDQLPEGRVESCSLDASVLVYDIGTFQTDTDDVDTGFSKNTVHFFCDVNGFFRSERRIASVSVHFHQMCIFDDYSRVQPCDRRSDFNGLSG